MHVLKQVGNVMEWTGKWFAATVIESSNLTIAKFHALDEGTIRKFLLLECSMEEIRRASSAVNPEAILRASCSSIREKEFSRNRRI